MGEGMQGMSYGSNIPFQGNGPAQGLPYPSNEGGMQIPAAAENHGQGPQLDLSLYYGSVMRPSLGPIMPMGQISYGPSRPQNPGLQGYAGNNLYGKPSDQKQGKYSLRFPGYRPTSALSLYKVSSV